MNSKKLGSFHVTGLQLIISDPCYPIECAVDDSDDFAWQLEPAKRGEWTATVFYEDDFTISKLVATHTDFKMTDNWIDTGKEVGVDSATAGIFDASVYGRDDAITYEVKNVHEINMDEEGLTYYVACCDAVASSEYEAGIVPGGVVSMSGIGDGYYPAYVQYDNQEIAAVLLDFWFDEEEE
ncbi:DUF4241 domain-containing protein [Priestia flexa]|uniref:DUF4241 domain-containing protein n=1 Tax=Priestia flexa TaxID=86664 RepID=UPI002890AF28|nr:DUF4241 domain-containing protein [Priestia flexa]MDT2046642.1 DUF4241 domain-containing protein [Priestia flexa]